MLRMLLALLSALLSMIGPIVTTTLDQNGPVVNLSSGQIEGFIANSTGGSPYYAFLSIPYALPPVGPLRFKPPEPFGRWTGVRNGSLVGPMCPQLSLINKEYAGDEDCLYLNVYIPQHAKWPQQLLPVMFYIHGGGFMYESGRYDVYGPQNYMDFPVVLVIINYRLGVLGFLSTNDSNAYGNYGMLDQVLAMKWVQNNIKMFGGDPNMVTIFGNSAGSASVSWHLLSPLSKDLFTKAISESGVALSDWALQRDTLKEAQKLAKVLKCPYNTTKKIIRCLNTKSAKEIVLGANQFQTTIFVPVNWAPSVEPPGGPGFITETAMSTIKNRRIVNKVPFIIGHMALEGYSFYWTLKPSFKYNGTEYFEKQFPDQLSLVTPIQPYMTSAIDAVANQYYSDVDLNNETVFIYTLSEILGDATMSVATAEAVDLLSEAGIPVYAYIYDYVSQDCLAELFKGKCGVYSSHGDELFIEFRYHSPTQPMDRNDTAMSNVINSLWVNFASDSDLLISGNQKWPLYSKSNPLYVELNLTPAIMRGPLSNVTSFWTETIPELISNYTTN